jgi:hypothetical protein
VLGPAQRGAQASYPKAVEWQVWFDHWRDSLGELQPWERLFIDACKVLQQEHVNMSKILRHGGEPSTVLALAEEKEVWYHKHRPRDFELPRWAVIGFKALDGAFSTTTRLARELDQIHRKGFHLVNTSEELQAVGAATAIAS